MKFLKLVNSNRIRKLSKELLLDILVDLSSLFTKPPLQLGLQGQSPSIVSNYQLQLPSATTSSGLSLLNQPSGQTQAATAAVMAQTTSNSSFNFFLNDENLNQK